MNVWRDRWLQDHHTFLCLLTIAVGCVGIVLSTVITNPFAQVYPFAVVAAGALGIAVHHYDGTATLPSAVIDIRFITSGALTGLSVAILLFHTTGFTRSVMVLAVLVVVYCLALLAILVNGVYTGLFLTILSGLVHRATIVFSSPIPLGSDGYYHHRHTQDLIRTGSLEQTFAFSKYYWAPAYHEILATTSQITSVDVHTAFFLAATSLYTIVPSLVIFAVVSHIYRDQRVAALGALLFVTADFTLGWSVFQYTTTVGMVFFALCIYFALRYSETKSKKMFALLLSCYVLVLITHQSTAFITLTVLCAMVGAEYYRARDTDAIILMLLLGAALTQAWRMTRYRGPVGDSPDVVSTLGIQLLPLLSEIGARSAGGVALPKGLDVATSVASGLTTIHVIGSGLLCGLAVLGVLTHLDFQWDQYVLQITAAICVMYAFAFGGPLLNIDYFFPMRWFQFITFALAPFAAIGLREIFSPDRLGRFALPALILFCGIWFVIMSGSFIGAVNDPVYDDANPAQRYSVDANEQQMYEFIADHHSETTVVADVRAEIALRRHYRVPETERLMVEYPGQRLTTADEAMLFVDRPYLMSGNAYFYILKDGERIRAFGELPDVDMGCQASVVYTSLQNEDKYQLHYSPAEC